MRVQFDPPFLPLQTVLLALAALTAAGALYFRWELRNTTRRRFTAPLLRGLVLLLLACILLNPVLAVRTPTQQVRPPLFVLLDTSRSMNTRDVPISGSSLRETRWKAARRITLENSALLEALRLRYDVRFYGFDERARARSMDDLQRLSRPEGSRTSLGDALNQVTAAGRAAAERTADGSSGVHGGVLLVSDGRDNGASYPLDAARAVRTAGFPVFTVCLGQETKGFDIAVTPARPQVFAVPGQSVELVAEIQDTGIPRTSLRLDLLREGRRVATRQIAVSPGRQRVVFPVTEKQKGYYRYTFVCAPAPGETNLSNNRANLFLNIMNARSRVLLLEGSPTWDARFLAQALRQDRTTDLDAIYQLTNQHPFALSGNANRKDLQIPRTVEALGRYDVIILGRGFESFYDRSSAEALKKWVSDRGGSLVLMRGRPYETGNALQELEPVDFGDRNLEDVRIRLTEAGKLHPGFAFNAREEAQTVVRQLPSLISATRVSGEKALTVVLARGLSSSDAQSAEPQEMAVLAYQRYGQGKVLALVGEGMWRWALLTPEMDRYSGVYREFWTQTIRWLVSDSDFLPGQNMALHTDRTAYSAGEQVNLLGYVRGQKPAALPAIKVVRPDGRSDRIAPAAGDGKSADFTATYRPSAPGDYMAMIQPPTGRVDSVPVSASFTVYTGQEEDANRSADPTLMRQIAAVTGGQALRENELSGLPDRLRAVERAVNRTDGPRSLWDRNFVLALIVALLTAEWLVRRRRGLA